MRATVNCDDLGSSPSVGAAVVEKQASLVKLVDTFVLGAKFSEFESQAMQPKFEERKVV